MYVCLCREVTEKQVLKTISGGANTVSALQEALGAGGQCGRCCDYLQGMLKTPAAGATVKEAGLSS